MNLRPISGQSRESALFVLRGLYAAVLKEPVPEKMQRILDRLGRVE